MTVQNKNSTTTERKTCPYCGDEFSGEKGLRIHMAATHDKQTIETVRCNWCGSPIEVREWKTEQNHYCTRSCGVAWTTYLKIGDRHPKYRDGTSRGQEFRVVAMAVRSRDGECVRCGRVKTSKDERALHVHHIVPEKKAEDPHDPQNLLSVCGGCHQALERLTPKEQLRECDIDSPEQLRLRGEAAELLLKYQKQIEVFASAPDPWPGMFAEAQKHLSQRSE
ncbi:HNH endonuclease [Natrinema hispanicum]|uniref:HNH endonuclease n=2 Tax=Natrinema hispanicum TaxID=392421 RepID=A0A1G6WTC7_9EURY|nr:HNH endonuclease [Natrinema hispanicum]